MPFDNSARFADNTVLFASQLNRIIDNLDETAPAKATSVGDLLIGGGTNAIERLGKGTANQFLRTTSDGATISWRGIGDSEITRNMIADDSIDLSKINSSLYNGLSLRFQSQNELSNSLPVANRCHLYANGQRVTTAINIDFSTITRIDFSFNQFSPDSINDSINFDDALREIEDNSILCINYFNSFIYFTITNTTRRFTYYQLDLTYISGSLSFNSVDIFDATFFYDSKRITVLDNAIDILSTEHGGTGRNHASFASLKAELQILNENVVDTPSIQANAITTPKITDLNITTQKLANLSVTTQKLANTSVTNTKIANNAIQTSQIQDGAITNAKLANDAINSAEIADLAINRTHISTTSATYGFGSDVPNNGKLLGIDDGTDATVGNRLVRYDIPSIAELDRNQVFDGFPGDSYENDNDDDSRDFGTVSGELLHQLNTHIVREPILYVGTERYAMHMIQDPGTSYTYAHSANYERAVHCRKVTNQGDLRGRVANATTGIKFCVWNNKLYGITWTPRANTQESENLYMLRVISLPYNREFPWFMTERGGYVNQFGSDFWTRESFTGSSQNSTNVIASFDYKGDMYILLQTRTSLSNYYMIKVMHNGFDSDGQPTYNHASPSIPITQPATSVITNALWQTVVDATVWNDTVYMITRVGDILKFTIPDNGGVTDVSLTGPVFLPGANFRGIAATMFGGAYLVRQDTRTSDPSLAHIKSLDNPADAIAEKGALAGYDGGTDFEVKSLCAVYPHRYWLGMNQRVGWDMQ